MVQYEISDRQLVIGASYFGSMMTAIYTKKRYGKHYINIVRTIHANIPEIYIQNVMKEAPTGAHILLTTFHEGVYLCTLGYKVSEGNKIPMMIFMRGTGTTRTNDAHYYQRRYDPFGNIDTKIVEYSEIRNTYYTYCRTKDFHNKQHQCHLTFEINGQAKIHSFVCQIYLLGCI